MKYLILTLGLYTLASAEYIRRPLSSDETINIYYECYGNITEAKRQIWLLQGGPGGSSDTLINYIKILYMLDPLGYYCTTDYRGVGRSSELRCAYPNQNECLVNSACEQEIESRYNLSDFYTQRAAEDVIALIKQYKFLNLNISTVLYGVSYGTFWLQKIMQNDANIADKWIFDGVVLQPWFENGAWQYGNYQFNEKIFNFLSRCLENSVCQTYLNVETVEMFKNKMIFELEKLKNYITMNGFYNIFSDPWKYSNNFMEVINLVNNIVHNKVFFSSRSEYCSDNDIVYKIVKANELYSESTSFNFHNYFLPLDTMTNDIRTTEPWINEVVRDYRPIVTNGEVLILAGEWDVQTVSENSIQLHKYFLNKNISSKILIASNYGHGVINFNINSNYCGLGILNQFIIGEELDESCLNNSNFKSFENAQYVTFEVEQNEVYYEIHSTAIIVLSVLFALLLTSNLIFISFTLYRRYRINKGINITMH